MKCNQQNCDNEAKYRFTWPGRDEAGICVEHAPKLRGLANAMGMHLQLIQIEEVLAEVRHILDREDAP